MFLFLLPMWCWLRMWVWILLVKSLSSYFDMAQNLIYLAQLKELISSRKIITCICSALLLSLHLPLDSFLSGVCLLFPMLAFSSSQPKSHLPLWYFWQWLEVWRGCYHKNDLIYVLLTLLNKTGILKHWEFFSHLFSHQINLFVNQKIQLISTLHSLRLIKTLLCFAKNKK